MAMRRWLRMLLFVVYTSVTTSVCVGSRCVVSAEEKIPHRKDKAELLTEEAEPLKRKTAVSIVGDEWYINGKPTFENREWQGASMQGLMPNSRMVNAIFDDANEHTRYLWNYPDTNKWDPERNTDEFIAALTDYRSHGLLGVTVSLQGGSVCGNDPKDKSHPQCSEHSFDKIVSGFDSRGNPKPDWFARLERVMDAADQLGMVVFLQFFYPKQAKNFETNDAVVVATEAAVDWLLEKAYTNFVIDLCNECDWDDNKKFMSHLPALLWPWHAGLLDRVKRRSTAGGRPFITSSSFIGGTVPTADKYPHIDYINLHANNLWQWQHGSLALFVDAVRQARGYRKMPIVITEDDGLCKYDGAMSWLRAEPDFFDPHQSGPQGSNCFFHFNGCRPDRYTQCAFGQSVAVKASWGLFLACCSFASCPAWAHDYRQGHGFQGDADAAPRRKPSASRKAKGTSRTHSSAEVARGQSKKKAYKKVRRAADSSDSESC